MRVAAIAGVVAVGIVAIVIVGVVLVRGTGRGAPESSAGDGGAAVVPVEATTAIAVATRAHADTAIAVTPLVDGLSSPAVLRIHVAGFDPFQRATAHQCQGDATGVACGNRLPVQFDEHGSAEFQYLVRADAATPEGDSRCGVDDPPCLVTITSLDRRQRAEIQTVFAGRLPPEGSAEVEPREGLADGERVVVEITGLPAGRRLTVTTCAAPGTLDRRHCGRPAPTAEAVVGADGSARTELTVTRGPVGARHLPCDDDHACAVVVLGDRADVRVAPVRITFGALPGAAYDPTRLGVGLALAVLFAGLTTWIVRRTDWSPIGEAAAPEIDQAVYADLDAIVAALPPDQDVSTRT